MTIIPVSMGLFFCNYLNADPTTSTKQKNVKEKNQGGDNGGKRLEQTDKKNYSTEVSPINTWKLSERHRNFLSLQQAALDKRNVHDFKTLTNNGIVIKEGNVTAIENDPENIELEVDIFEYDNARSMLLRILDLILTHGYMNVPVDLQGNLRVLYNGLSNDWADYSHTFEARSGDEED